MARAGSILKAAGTNERVSFPGKVQSESGAVRYRLLGDPCPPAPENRRSGESRRQRRHGLRGHLGSSPGMCDARERALCVRAPCVRSQSDLGRGAGWGGGVTRFTLDFGFSSWLSPRRANSLWSVGGGSLGTRREGGQTCRPQEFRSNSHAVCFPLSFCPASGVLVLCSVASSAFVMARELQFTTLLTRSVSSGGLVATAHTFGRAVLGCSG